MSLDISLLSFETKSPFKSEDVGCCGGDEKNTNDHADC